LNGVTVPFREGGIDGTVFSPLCLIGPNGTGKSQVLQIIAEIFQAIFAKYLPDEEQGSANDTILFDLIYLITLRNGVEKKVWIYRRKSNKKKKAEIVVEAESNDAFILIEKNDEIVKLLPSKVVGYTSGDNETLSIPFFVSRAGYANQVRT